MSRLVMPPWLGIVAALVISACGATTVRPSSTMDAEQIALPDADPNGLAWDAQRSVLVVANDRAPELLFVGADRQVTRRSLGAIASGAGGLVLLDDGSIASARFGAHGDGAIVTLGAAGAVAVRGIDPARHRLGFAARGGALYLGWFTGNRAAWTGGVTRLDPSATSETELMSGLGKVVGVALVGDRLFAADQTHDVIVACTLPACADVAPFASVPSPDLMTASASGLFVSSGSGAVYAVDAQGRTRVVASSLGGQPRGLAVDERGHRLFVALHAPVDGNAIVIVDLAR